MQTIHINEIIRLMKESDFINSIDQLNCNYRELIDENNKLKEENQEYKKQLKICMDECSNLNKVSYVKSLSNQLMERNQYIVQLEAQINKSKPSRSSQSTQPSQPTCEPTQPTCEPFDEDKYQEIDGYELLKYKNNYYLKNIKTNDLYNIKEYQANEVVGKITLKGKIKLN